ncbi:MAG TPA: PAS domain-containing sensor histidine kinase, partial [Mucilaginibacter sp.]|nr:PAS domain-containing sensor histidine kinase [Mucilaginibacter sp.]
HAGKARQGEIEFSVIDKNGLRKYIRMQFETELDKDGWPENIAGFNQDVTKQKLAQIEIQKNIEELQAAGERQSAILNALPPHIVLLNEAGKIVAVNESWRKFTLKNNLGVPRYGIDYSYTAISEKATGVDEVSGKQIAKGIKDVISGLIDEFSLEYSFYEKRKKVWYQIIVAPLRDKRRKGAVVLHIDITERKMAEELMLQSEANLRTTFENIDIAYVLCNRDNKIVSFNAKASELCMEQFNKKLKTGGLAFSYFPQKRIPNIKEAIKKVLNNERVSYETSYALPDGSSKWYEVRWAGVANEKKENIGFILAFKDITDRKVTEIERDRMTADLVQRYRDLEQFTYIVSHNLRAPVANIMGLSNILNTFEYNLTEREDVLSALETSINILDQIIIDLNHILQVHSNLKEDSEEVTFQSLVDEITLNLGHLIAMENIAIETNFSESGKIFTIKSYMYSIFYNLIVNSINYRQTGVKSMVSISTRKKEGNLEILFKDNGKGIDEKNIKNLFGLYKRFDNTVEGKGMGLFMVKMQTENLGGKIHVQSTLDIGTIFRLEFPISNQAGSLDL